ncbi:uncharacterized protein P884DRAFT_276246 [Thermothelomyces heterothallicus CBS 202.75]|uniref:uncharacterized protein n=1 Tax=Thermothelomyces heterothallicus CBS 202.75 TaxID=1149848 RepID=UPI003742AB39
MPHPYMTPTTRYSGQTTTETPPGPDNVGPYLLRVIWALAGLSTLFLGLRVYCKLSRRRRLWWDDNFLIAGWIALIYAISLLTVAVHHGLGRHYEDLSEEAIASMGMFSMAGGFGNILATCWTKTSFAITLLRISEGGMRRTIWFIIISVNLVLGSNGIIHWIQCWPVQKTWRSYLEGSCFTPDIVRNYNTAVAVFSGVMDIVLALLPWKIIWSNTINRRERLGALVAMSAGIIDGVMAFLKIRTMYVIGNANTTTVDLQIFGTAEPATAIMAASIPMLRVLIQRDDSSKPSEPEFVQLRTTSSTARGTDLLSNDTDKKRSTGSSWPGFDVQAVEEVHVRQGDEKDKSIGLAV